MRNLILVLALVLVTAAGCIEGPEAPRYPAACSTDGPLMWGAFDGRTPTDAGMTGPETDPRQPWRTVLAMRGDPSFGLVVEHGNATLEWSGNGTDRMAIVTQQPPAQPLGFNVTADGVDCVRFPSPDWNISAPREGAVAEVGKGAIVYTAGFWENGTLFYTNMPEIHDGPDHDGQAWPRAGWYAWEGEDPLPVYVYDKDSSEIPPQWSAGNNVPAGGPLGPIDSSLPGRYFVTIPGFNNALKGLSTSTMTAVRVAPEDAYTRPGNEDHPLYGDALVFLIRVELVADQPCPPPHAGNLDSMDFCFRK